MTTTTIHKWRCPACRRWVTTEPIERTCRRCRPKLRQELRELADELEIQHQRALKGAERRAQDDNPPLRRGQLIRRSTGELWRVLEVNASRAFVRRVGDGTTESISPRAFVEIIEDGVGGTASPNDDPPMGTLHDDPASTAGRTSQAGSGAARPVRVMEDPLQSSGGEDP